jgi:hypothetical protein
MRRALPIVVLAALAAAPAASAARVDLLVVGKHRTLRGPEHVRLRPARVRASGHRCHVRARTPLAVLAHTSLRLRVRDYGGCGGSLYVRAVGHEHAHGADGWVYKVGRRIPSLGAGDPGERLHGGAHLLWFWCRQGAHGCQRTLAVHPRRRKVAPGSRLRVRVKAYDDHGRAVPAGGATVRLGPARAVAGPGGVAVVRVPHGRRHRRLVATQHGRVRSFAVRVAVR